MTYYGVHHFVNDLQKIIVSDEDYINSISYYHRHYVISIMSDIRYAENQYARRAYDNLSEIRADARRYFKSDLERALRSLIRFRYLKQEQIASIYTHYRKFTTRQTASFLLDSLPGGANFEAFVSEPDEMTLRLEKIDKAFTYSILPISFKQYSSSGMGSEHDRLIFGLENNAFGCSFEDIPFITFYFENQEDEILTKIKYPC